MMFSVIMCTYNSEVTLAHAVESVIKQTFENWELLILDNGSKDGTIKMLQEYECQEPRISCIYREDNVGWCKGISICLEQAKGQYMMFLGADDYLAAETTLGEVAEEIEKHQPDIVWTANGFAIFENNEYKVVKRTVPNYCVYQGEDKLMQLYQLMTSVYYNSVMHYVKIDFLKAHNIDFFDPFYGDCQGMTEAICKADKMVVMDKMEYVLTVNTSQTAKKVDYEYDIARQWQSVKDALGDLSVYPRDMLGAVAERIFQNQACMCESVAVGAELRNGLMNEVKKGIPERFFKVEEWLSSDAFGEMMYYSDKLRFEEHLIGAAGVLYWGSKKYGIYAEQIRSGSKWLADFVEAVLGADDQGNLFWKTEFDDRDECLLLGAIDNEANRHRVGVELLMKDGIVYRNQLTKEKIGAIRDEYREWMRCKSM